MTRSLVSALNRVADGKDLDAATAREVMDEIMEGVATPAQMGGFLAALRVKGPKLRRNWPAAEAGPHFHTWRLRVNDARKVTTRVGFNRGQTRWLTKALTPMTARF